MLFTGGRAARGPLVAGVAGVAGVGEASIAAGVTL